MATKGPSMCYGNTNGAHHRGEATENINFVNVIGKIGKVLEYQSKC